MCNCGTEALTWRRLINRCFQLHDDGQAVFDLDRDACAIVESAERRDESHLLGAKFEVGQPHLAPRTVVTASQFDGLRRAVGLAEVRLAVPDLKHDVPKVEALTGEFPNTIVGGKAIAQIHLLLTTGLGVTIVDDPETDI